VACENAFVPGTASERRRPVVGWVLLLVVLAIQVRLLYAPDLAGPALFAGADKVVHAGLFGLPALIALLGRLRPRQVLLLLVIHAPVSEVVQGALLTRRTGDPWDAVADLVGVALALGLWALLPARRDAGRPSPALID
jgi:hypothetical protein